MTNKLSHHDQDFILLDQPVDNSVLDWKFNVSDLIDRLPRLDGFKKEFVDNVLLNGKSMKTDVYAVEQSL